MPRIGDVNVVKTRAEATALLDRIWRQQKQETTPAGVDTEFGRDEANGGREFLTVWSVSTGKGDRNCLYVEPSLPVFTDWLQDPKAPKVYQNYPADHDSLAANGIKTRGLYADIMVMSAIVDSSERRHDLKYLAWKYLGVRRTPFAELFSYIPPGKKKPVLYTWDEIFASKRLRRLLYGYSANDAEDTARLFKYFQRRMQSDGWNYWPTYYEIDRKFTLTLVNMMSRGMLVDVERLTRLDREFRARLARMLHRIREEAGEPKLNLNSGPQLQKLFFDKFDFPALRATKTGYAVDKDTLQKWSEAGLDIATMMLGYRGIESLRKTFTTGVLNSLEDDGRLYSDMNQIGGQTTGRISSRKYEKWVVREKVYKSGKIKKFLKKVKAGANLQNIPARSQEGRRIRECFIAEEDRKLIIGDLGGAEWWMMGHWSRDPIILKQNKEGIDPHSYSAVFLFGDNPLLKGARLTWEEFKALTKKDERFARIRGDAKQANFSFLYGCADERAAEVLGLKTKSGRWDAGRGGEYLRRFFALYQGIPRYQRRMIAFCREHGYVETISGRRQQFPGIYSDNGGEVGHAEREAINTPVQGSIADLIKVALNLLEFDRRMRAWNARVLNTVHDEIVGSAPTRVADKVAKHVQKVMVSPFADKLLVRMPAEVKAVDNWSQK